MFAKRWLSRLFEAVWRLITDPPVFGVLVYLFISLAQAFGGLPYESWNITNRGMSHDSITA